MDPVSRLLVERERALPRLAPWIVLAVLGHGVCVAATIWLGREGGPRPGHLPAVSVRLVQPQLAAAASSPANEPAGTMSRPAQEAPEPEPVEPEPVEPEPVEPEPPASPPEDPAPTEDAMPAAEAGPRPTPRPTAQPAREPSPESADTDPAPAASGTSRGSSRLSLGGEGAGAPPGIPSDFQFTYYVERMLSLIESKWYRPPVPPETRAQVRFNIMTSGRLEGIQLESSSGISSFDRAVLRALYAANPLPPLPPAYRKPSLTVHLTFSQ